MEPQGVVVAVYDPALYQSLRKAGRTWIKKLQLDWCAEAFNCEAAALFLDIHLYSL